jgi:general secretion pathway protein I
MSTSLNPDTAGHRRRGFTLLEILIAFTLLAIAMGALMQAFSSGLRTADAVSVRMTALLHARAKLEEVGPLIPIEPGVTAGRFADGFDWRVDIAPYAEPDIQPGVVVLREVRVEVSGMSGRPVALTTLRLVVPR